MTVNDIISLANAGFNAEQISKLMELNPAPAPEPAPAPAPAPEPAPEPDYFKQIMDKLSNIQTTVQSNNILGVETPTPEKQTTEDILASIINPPKVNGK